MARKHVVERLNPDFGYFYTVERELHREKTTYQDLELIETKALGKVMLLDGITQVCTKNDWLYHEPMVHPALACHPDPRQVCIIGAGDGGILREVLKHRVERAVMCELDGGVIDSCKKLLPEVTGGCFEDLRSHVVVGDGRAYIQGQKGVFDTVIMDMTDPFGPSTMLYTKEYYQEVKRSLRDSRGMFVMHGESPISRPRSHQQILKTLGTVWRHQAVFYLYIQMYAVLWSIVIASDHDEVQTISADELRRRLATRGISGLEVYTPETHHSMQVAFPFVAKIRSEAAGVPVVTDANPKFLDEIDINRAHAPIQIREG